MKDRQESNNDIQVQELTEQLSNINDVNDLDYNKYLIIKQLSTEEHKSLNKSFIARMLMILLLPLIGASFISLPFILNITSVFPFVYPIIMGLLLTGTGILFEVDLFRELPYNKKKKLFKALKKQKLWEKLKTLADEYEKTDSFKQEQKIAEQQQLNQKYKELSSTADSRLIMAESQISLLTKKLEQLKQTRNGNSHAEFEDTSFVSAETSINMSDLTEIEMLIKQMQTVQSQIEDQSTLEQN